MVRILLHFFRAKWKSYLLDNARETQSQHNLRNTIMFEMRDLIVQMNSIHFRHGNKPFPEKLDVHVDVSDHRDQ